MYCPCRLGILQTRDNPPPPHTLCTELENWVSNASVANVKLNTYVDSGTAQAAAARGAAPCWAAPAPAMHASHNPAPHLTQRSALVAPHRARLRLCAAEFTGSLAQLQEGLQKLNLNEEVRRRPAWGPRRGACSTPCLRAA